MHKHQYLRLMSIISGDDPQTGGPAEPVPATEPVDKPAEEKTEPATEPEPAEPGKTLSQEELNAIIERRVGKQKAEVESIRQQYEDSQKKLAELEEQKQKDIEDAEKRGRTEAKREQLAKEYGVDVDLLPEDDDKLKRYQEQMNVTINNRRKVLPVEVVDRSNSSLPSFIGRAHA